MYLTLLDGLKQISTCPGWSVPGKYVFAGIWVDHGSKLGDDNPVGLDVPFVGVTLQKLTSVSHLT